MNLVIFLILDLRKRGAKHSDIDWATFRKAYDYLEEQVDA